MPGRRTKLQDEVSIKHVQRMQKKTISNTRTGVGAVQGWETMQELPKVEIAVT
jgi:hypothetical protein